jgi:hypothetical protein
MANLFDKSKKKAPKSKAKSDKTNVILSDKEMNKKFARIIELKSEIDTRGGELKGLLAGVLVEGKKNFVAIYEKEQKNPGSFNMTTEDGQKVLVVPMEKYPKVDEDLQTMLEEIYGEEEDDSPVKEETIYSFEPRLLEKYGEAISTMIEESEDIAEEDKEELLVATTSLAIKKGTIDKLHTLGEGVIQENFDLLQPGFQMKNFAEK